MSKSYIIILNYTEGKRYYIQKVLIYAEKNIYENTKHGKILIFKKHKKYKAQIVKSLLNDINMESLEIENENNEIMKYFNFKHLFKGFNDKTMLTINKFNL